MVQRSLPLTQQQCEHYPSGTPPLPPPIVAQYLAQVPGWSVGDAAALHKAYRFRDFAGGLALVNRIGALAEEQDHHPDLLLGWGRVEVTLTTHSVGGLSLNDFILAARIDLLAENAPGLRP